MYGAIVRNVTRAGGAGTQAAVAHAINDATHCTFLIQDITVAGAARALPRAYVLAADYGANTDQITDDTVAGALRLDALVVAAHSRYDVGPIVTGPTRALAQVSSWARTGVTPIYPGHPPMRSLHSNVPFTLNGVATIDVNIVHRLGTTNVVAFASPRLDPVDAGAVGDLANVWQQAVVDADTITMRMALASGGVPVAPTTVRWDIMVLSRWGAGLHSSLVRQHSVTGGGPGFVPTYVNGDDYSGANNCRQITLAQMLNGNRTTPSYGCLYTNVDGVIQAGVVLTHNMGSATGVMALVGARANIGLNKPVIANNATSATTATLANAVNAALDNNDILFVRPYSPYLLLVS